MDGEAKESVTSTAQPAPRWRLASGPALVAYLAAALLLLHMLYARQYGYFRDELYFLACGRHLDWGYVDQPPLIAVIAAAARLVFGESLRAIRFLPAAAAAGWVLLTGLLVRELGGGRFAQALAGLAVCVAPGYLALGYYLSMNAFEPLFWMGCVYFLMRILKTGNGRLWLWFGLLAGLGLQNKQTTILFGFAVVAGLLLTSERRLFRSAWPWLGGLVALLIFLPNLLWQYQHGFPMIELQNNIRAAQKNVTLAPLSFVGEQIGSMGPLAGPIWLAGLGYYFLSRDGRRFRALGWAYLIMLATLVVLKSRVYYLFPAYPMLLAAGSVVFQRLFDRGPRWQWALGAYAALMLVSGALLAPMGMPVLPEETFIRYTTALGIQQPAIENRKTGPLPQFFADMHGWEEMAEVAARVYNGLSPGEKAKAAIFCGNYGEAGAIDMFGPRYGLPRAISGHQNYFFWGTRNYTGEIVIWLDGNASPEKLSRMFQSVAPVAEVRNAYAMPYENFSIYLCRRFKGDLSESWARFKSWR